MTAILENKYIEPELRYVETSKFELRKEKEAYHKEQLDIEEEESDKFTSLVESMRLIGILQPVYVIEREKDRYEVVDGGRRLRAAKFLQFASVPAMVFRGEYDETEIRKRSLIANVNRKDLTAEEKGEGLCEYYRSGGVDPQNAISYLNTLRQRKQIKNAKIKSGAILPTVGKIGHKPLGYTKPEDGEEYERFLELHKNLGIPRITQYTWLTHVIYIPKEIRTSDTFKRLPKIDRQYLIRSEVRDHPKIQKQIVTDLSTINKEIEKAKSEEKKGAIEARVEPIRQKKEQKLREYFPDETPKKKRSAFDIYGQINGRISNLWTALMAGKYMPNMTDDVLNDHIKPTRTQFEEYVGAIGRGERNQQFNWLEWVSRLIDDRMKILERAIGQK